MFSVLLVILSSSWASLQPTRIFETPKHNPVQSYSSIHIEDVSGLGNRRAGQVPSGFAALNQDFSNEKITVPAGEVVVIEKNEVIAFDRDENPFVLGVLGDSILLTDLTMIDVDSKTGELVEFNIPSDLQFAGKGKVKKRKGKTTYCYRQVKARVGRYVTLTGGSAYMANNQLRRQGFTRMSYAEAPYGSVCVFGRGGRRTESGGHKHGHVGIKGSGGVINPQIGFALGRPFLGCYNPKES